MEIKSKYRIDDVDNKLYLELASYCNKNDKKIDSDNEYFYILEQWEYVKNGIIKSNKESYDGEIKKRNNAFEIERLKVLLSESDYKVIKCYEMSLIGKEMPYDIQQLHTERQEIRNKINSISKL